jgi:hypothetical protein
MEVLMKLTLPRKLILAAALVFGGLSAGGPHLLEAQAQSAPLVGLQAARCEQRQKVVQVLNKQFKEQPRAMGLVANRMVMELYVAKSGTWSLVLTGANGVSCLVVAGNSFEAIARPPGPGPLRF